MAMGSEEYWGWENEIDLEYAYLMLLLCDDLGQERLASLRMWEVRITDAYRRTRVNREWKLVMKIRERSDYFATGLVVVLRLRNSRLLNEKGWKKVERGRQRYMVSWGLASLEQAR